MYLGAEETKKTPAKTSWTGADYASVLTPVGNVITSIFGQPAGQNPPAPTTSQVNWPLIAVAGFGVITLGAVILTKKKRRR